MRRSAKRALRLCPAREASFFRRTRSSAHEDWSSGKPVLPQDLELFDTEQQDERGTKCVIDRYGLNTFYLGDHVYRGSVFVFPTSIYSWNITTIDDLTRDHLSLAYLMLPPVRKFYLHLNKFSLIACLPGILLLGCGAHTRLIHPDIRKFYREKGIVIEAMDTVISLQI